MVKVMENSMVDLDIVPGKDEQQMQAAVRQQAQSLRTGGSEQAQQALKNLPPEQQEQAKGILANAQGMAGGVAQAGGGAVKGVLDTAGNTVGAVGGGLANTVGGVTEGLGNTVKSGGNIAREGLGSGEGEGEGATAPAGAPEKADEVTSKYQKIDVATIKNPKATNCVMQRVEDATRPPNAGNTLGEAAAEAPEKGTYVTSIVESKKKFPDDEI